METNKKLPEERYELIPYLKNLGTVGTAEVKDGQYGDYIKLSYKDGTYGSIPIGKRSQGKKLTEYWVIIVDDSNNPGTKIAIATSEAPTLDLVTFD